MTSIPNLPPSLKPIQEYLIKANQLAKARPVVAHYCKLYAVEHGLKVRDTKDKSTTAFLLPLMDELEKEKKDNPELHQREDAKIQVELCALEIFKKADDQYYAGTANKTTAASFRAAASLMEVCRQFGSDGEMPADLKEKHKYSKVKVLEIIKCVQEGRPVVPPALDIPGEDGGAIAEGNEESDDDAPPPPPANPPPSDSYYKPPAPAQTTPAANTYNPNPRPVLDYTKPPPQPVQNYTAPPPPQPAAQVKPQQPVQMAHPVQSASGASFQSAQARPRVSISTEDLVLAEKYTKYALSSLQFDDVKEAVANLKLALSKLT